MSKEKAINLLDQIIGDSNEDLQVAKLKIKLLGIIDDMGQVNKFDLKIHILKPVDLIVGFLLDNDIKPEDRPKLESLLVELFTGIYNEKVPTIKYLGWIPFLGKWLSKKMGEKAIAWCVDWILDKIYGED